MVVHTFNPNAWEAETDLYEFKDSLVYRVIPGQRYTENLSQKVKVKIKELEVKMKPHKDGIYTESLDYVYYCVFFEFFDCEGAKYRETFHYMGCQGKPEWI